VLDHTFNATRCCTCDTRLWDPEKENTYSHD
jgi:hypothetical protein